MVTDGSYLRVNARDVAAKVVDGEAVLINLSNGLYYSTDRVGAYVWSMIAGGSTVELMVLAVADHYQVTADQARSDVRNLVAELLRDNLIETGNDIAAPPAPPPAGAEGPYEPPKLVRYDDMAGMFALDPPLPELPDVPRSGRP